ncbi:MAG TPA: KUP/HAK/KT family potassium transporter [Cytophagaceae bacterium]|jgi:KUP system potassium uptake protein
MVKHTHSDKISAAGLLITLGIIYGDIGTSPLYTMRAIIGKEVITPDLILGALSCIFWTLTFLTTIKYVTLALRADNNGEGGIFSLFALVRRRSPKLVVVAIIGGSALLADGIITPPISVSSAIEGLKIHNPDLKTIPIIIGIIVVLFIFQGFGTKSIGRAFGPIMTVWFIMLAILGVNQIVDNPAVFRGLNPYYAYNLLVNYPGGFLLLASVFLCTTGAEALYSDMGHCGRKNIRLTWMLVKVALVLNYFGQGAWLLKMSGQPLNDKIPFYMIMPDWFFYYGITIATMAAVIASQALITGSFTLISEAIRLNLWPKVKINYPTILKGQIYVPSINWLLMFGCIGIVLYFEESKNMEGAYGLAISLTMLMTSILLAFYFTYIKKIPILWVSLCLLIYLFIEGAFLFANLHKFTHGGYVTLLITIILIVVMWTWYTARKIKNRLTEFVKLKDYYPLLKELSGDLTVPKFATHLVYLTSADNPHEIESKVIYSIFQKQPKRADIYWLLHIDVLDEPYTMEYKVDTLLPHDVIKVEFRLGFRIEHRINLFFRRVVEDLVRNKEVDFTSRYASLNRRNVIGDFRFVVLEKHLSHDNDLPRYEQFVMDVYFLLKHFGQSEASAFGLDTSSVTIEKVPMVISPLEKLSLKRIR